MAPGAQHSGVADLVQVADSAPVAFGLAEVGHLQVFFPADKRTVRAAEGGIGGAVADSEGNGGELFAGVRVEFAQVVIHRHFPEARSPGRCFQKESRFLCGGLHFKELRTLVPGKKGFADFPDRDFGIVRRDDVPVAEIREFRKDQVVHFVEGIDAEGDISPPFKIIKQVRQFFSPALNYTFESHSRSAAQYGPVSFRIIRLLSHIECELK